MVLDNDSHMVVEIMLEVCGRFSSRVNRGCE